MSNQQHWPTAKQLKFLREQGIVPYSSSASFYIVILCLLLTFFLQSDRIFKILNWTTWLHVNDLDRLSIQLAELVNLTVSLTIVCLSSFLLSGLLQNKFLFNFKLLGSNIDKQQASTVFSLFMQAVSFFGRIIILAGFYYFFFELLINYGSKLASINQKDGLTFAAGYSGLVVLIILLILLVVLSILLTRIIFLYNNRMSSQEIREEQRA